MNNTLLGLVIGVIAGAAIATIGPMVTDRQASEAQLIKEFYAVENAAHVSPHGVRKHIADQEYIIVDLRSQQEYEEGHIIGAVNVPAYATPDKSDYGAVERIVGAFITLDAQAKLEGKEVVVYCYSAACMTGRKIGGMLAEHDIYVKHLGIGWQEWRYYWNLWNHSGETPVDPMDYVWSGPEPGIFVDEVVSPCDIGGEFGC